MPEVKNIFVGAKMNKDLNPRMISNQEYIDARNAAVINSEGSDSGLLQNVSGNTELTDFGLEGVNLEVIGFYIDTTNNRIFAFITDWNDVSNDQLSNFASSTSHHYICVFDTRTNQGATLVSGSFLNFSKTHPVLGINLLENLLFFTDNRNQPRKINVNTALINPNYYSKEEHISVAKYYPYNAPRLIKDRGDGSLLVNSIFRITTNVTSITDGVYTTSTFTVDPVGGTSAEFQVIASVGAAASIQAIKTTGDAEYYVGEDFNVGDEITIPSGTLTGQTGDLVFVVRDENMAKEGTMKDVVSENLPLSITSTVNSFTGVPTTSLDVPTGVNTNWVGATITQATNSITVDSNVTIASIATGATDTITINNPNNVNFNTDDITIGANPYYDAGFDGDSDFLSDKFARFSYRFKYDDGEYSLIAPFSQIAFIPKQDGYFLDENGVPETVNDEDNPSDENEAIKSTIISFFENKVNSLELIINMPEGVNSVSELIDELKVNEIDIVYKQSDQNTIKVIDTITRDDIVTNSNTNLVYTYNSQLPIKTLPQNETTRASDKVPIRAKSQEVTGNRVMYGNYLVRTARPNSLDYSISTDEKSELGQLNSVNEIEYPNHTLKQNRSYKVGVVLSDKFGRQSDVITSPNSTVYVPYLGQNPDYIIDPSGSILGQIYRGNSLKINFASEIPETITRSGYAGLYSETNPNGWYGYKVVVQQREQEYYNVYIPTILNNYPQDATTPTSNDTAFITLFSDNINKVPRDLKEVGPQDVQFSSSVELFPRVSNSLFNSSESTNQQISTSKTPDKAVSIGTRDELGLDTKVDGEPYTVSPFYSIPDAPIAETASTNRILNLGANPYIGKVSTQEQIGAAGGDASTVTFENVRLNVYETEAFESALDVYYETSTSGLISELNTDIKDGISGLVPYEISDWTFVLNENYTSDQLISTTPFDVLNSQGVSLTSLYGANVSVEILSIIDENDVFLDKDLFRVVQQGVAPFKFQLRTGLTADSFVYTSPSNSYTINFKLTNTNGGVDYTGIYSITGEVNKLSNSPIIETTGSSVEADNFDYSVKGFPSGAFPVYPTNKMITWNSWAFGFPSIIQFPALDINTPQWSTLQDFQFQNGANDSNLQDEELVVEFNKLSLDRGILGNILCNDIKINLSTVRFYNTTYPGYFFDPDRDYDDKIRLRRVVESGVVKYRLEYSNLLRPYNEYPTTYNNLYIEPSSTGVLGTQFNVFLKVKDANNLAGSLGMSTGDIDDSPSSVFLYQFYLTN